MFHGEELTRNGQVEQHFSECLFPELRRGRDEGHGRRVPQAGEEPEAAHQDGEHEQQGLLLLHIARGENECD